MDIKPITSFFGDYRFLSNFYPCNVEIEGIVYPSSEHAYVAYKTTDPELRKQILDLDTAGKVKRFGRKIKLRDDWEEIKIDIMFSIIKAKFDQNEDLKQKLIDTWPAELIEGNTWGDTFWGECPIGTGKNMLGKILMGVRSRYRMEQLLDIEE